MELGGVGPIFSVMKFSLILLCAAVVLPFEASASGYKFKVTLTGGCYSNAPSGVIESRVISSDSILREYSVSKSIPLSKLAMVYHLYQDPRGDALEVINTTDGSVVDTPYLLYFGDDTGLGRMSLTNSVGTQVRKIHYVYTSQSSHSLGSCVLNELLNLDSSGNVTGALITGTMSWITTPFDGTTPMQVINATITTTGPVLPWH